MSSNLSFFSALSRGVSSVATAAANSSFVTNMKQAAVKGIAKAAINVLPPEMLKSVADYSIDYYMAGTEYSKYRGLATKAVDFLIEIKRHNSPRQIIKLGEQLLNLFKNHSEDAVKFLSQLEKKNIDLGSLLMELSTSDGADATYQNLNGTIVELMNSVRNPELRKSIEELLTTVESIAGDDKLRAAARAALKSKNAEALFGEIFDLFIVTPRGQNRAMTEFKTQLVAAATNDLWQGLSKANSLSKVTSVVSIAKSSLSDANEAIDENWNAAQSIAAQRTLDDLRGVTHDLLKTGCLSQVIRHMPNEILAKLMPQSVDPAVKELIFDARKSKSIKSAISLLMEPLARLYLNPTIQKVLKKNKNLAMVLAKEAATLLTPTGGTTPELDRLFAELRPLMHDARSRSDILDLIQALKQVYSIEHLKDAVGKKLNSHGAQTLVGSHLKEQVGDFAAVANEMVACVTDDLWELVTETANSEKIANLGAVIATKIENYVPSENQSVDPLTAEESTALHKELAEVANLATGVAKEILPKMAGSKRLHAIVKQMPAETITLIKGNFDTILSQVKNPLIKKALALLGEFQATEEGTGALTSLIPPAVFAANQQSFPRADDQQRSRHQCDDERTV